MELDTVAKISAIFIVTIVSIGLMDTVWKSSLHSGAPAPTFEIAQTGN